MSVSQPYKLELIQFHNISFLFSSKFFIFIFINRFFHSFAINFIDIFIGLHNIIRFLRKFAIFIFVKRMVIISMRKSLINFLIYFSYFSPLDLYIANINFAYCEVCILCLFKSYKLVGKNLKVVTGEIETLEYSGKLYFFQYYSNPPT